MVNGIPGVYLSYWEGETLVEYEDPRIMFDFNEALEKNGIKSEMPAFDYKKDVRWHGYLKAFFLKQRIG